jgi:hypothetical protein
LPYNSLIFGTLVQHGGNSTAHGWVHGAEQGKSRRTVNFQKLCNFKSLSNVENRQKNERTVSIEPLSASDIAPILHETFRAHFLSGGVLESG